MFDYTKLENEIEETRGRAKHIVDKAVEEKREMSETERREYDSLYGEIAAKRSLVDQLKDNELDELRKRIDSETPEKPKAAGSMNDTLRAMGYGQEITCEHRDWTSASGASATLQTEWHNRVLEIAFEESIARKMGIQSFATSTTHNIPYMSAYGSATAVIVAEMTAYTEDDPTISNVQFGAYKFVKRVDVAEELLADASYDIAGLLARAYGVAFGRAEDRYFVSACGTGTSTPSGIMSHSATTSGAAASGITVDELIAFHYSLPRHYREGNGGAVWLMNDITLGYLAALRATPSATEGYFWNDSVGGEPARLWGHPIYTCSDIPSKATASAKIIGLTNPKYFMIGDRAGLNVKRLQLNEFSDTFAGSKRMDAHPLTSSATVVFTTSTA